MYSLIPYNRLWVEEEEYGIGGTKLTRSRIPTPQVGGVMMTQDISSEKVSNIHSDIKNVLDKQLLRAGLERTDTAGLIPPENDKSVPFTGATITIYKEEAEKAAQGAGLVSQFMHQPCLRLQSLKSIFDKDIPEFYGYFNMVGGILSPTLEFPVIKALAQAFNVISDNRMLMKVSKSETPFYDVFSDDFQLEFDSHQPGYYHWQFGTDIFYGRGTTIALISKSNHVIDVGNVVRLYNAEGEHFASEIGFGVEIATSVVLDTNIKWHGYAYHHLAKEKGLESPRLISALIVSIAMVQVGVQADHSKRGRLLKRSCKNVGYLLNLEDKTVQDVMPAIQSFAAYLSLSDAQILYVQDLMLQKYKEVHDELKLFSKKIQTGQNNSDQNVSGVFSGAANEDANIPGILKDKVIKNNGFLNQYREYPPTWLAPIQARIIPISDRHLNYCIELSDRISKQKALKEGDNLRVDCDVSNNRMQKKIRDAQVVEKIPYILIVGDKEMEAGTVSVRLRSNEVIGNIPVNAVIEHLANEVEARCDFEFGTNIPVRNKEPQSAPNAVPLMLFEGK
jgi:hypothetical protein